MFLPFAEFDDSEDLAFLKEIAEKSQTVCFSPDEEGGIRVHIFTNYFEELMSAEHKSCLLYTSLPFGRSWRRKLCCFAEAERSAALNYSVFKEQ